MAKRDIFELISQRLQYVLHGNYHGVSAGWLNKNGVENQDLVEYFLERGHNLQLVLETLDEGAIRHEEACRTSVSHHYSTRYNSERELSKFLYSYVLLEKPTFSVETGVANGVSTKILMSALEQTGGILHSFDIDEEASNAYRGTGKWEFHKLPKKSTGKAFQAQIASFQNVDLWIHDSNHGFKWQIFEYRLAISKLLQTNGILVSDDIDASTAWGFLSKLSPFQFKMFFDSRKMVGFVELKSAKSQR